AVVELPARAAALGAAALLVGSTVLVNLSPPNPYLWTKPRPTRQHELAPLSMATRTAAMLWPLAAIGFALTAALGQTPRPERGPLAGSPSSRSLRTVRGARR
ncbi:MAG: hypothetical protein H7125_16695, partial [Proteobacteria bacterium]|nr:hypothetical protein [Burkholderiales bacterium]